MKTIFSFLLLLLCSLGLTAQQKPQIQRIAQTTYEANSPSVWAKNFDASYGIKPSVLDGLAELYKKDGLDSLTRQKKVEKLIRDFTLVAPKDQQKQSLSAADRQQLGIANQPAIAEALEWHLYTTGPNSPAVYALGNVKIWYGIPKKAFLGIVVLLEEKQAQIEDFDKKLREQVERYEKLEKSLVNREDEMAKEAKLLLDEGKIDEAVKVLGDLRYALKRQTERAEKREAEAAFDYAEGLALQLKYDSASVQYKDAVELDPTNSKYLLAYAGNEHTCAHYDEAITYYQKALAIDTVAFKDQTEKTAVLYNNLGLAYNKKGRYERAIGYYEKALAIDSAIFGNKHPSVARDYNNLGFAWHTKGKYDLAIAYYEKARLISIQAFGVKHPNVAVQDNNLGTVYLQKSDYGRAIAYFEKALTIDSLVFGNKHPAVGRDYNNLGEAWKSKSDYDRAIAFYKNALAIDSIVFSNEHPNMVIRYNNLGETYRLKGKYDLAIAYFEKALAIGSVVFDNDHPDIAIIYNNLGLAWKAKGEYDRAIVYYENALVIFLDFLGPNHPSTKTSAQNLSRVAYDRGMELLREKKITEANPYFVKAFDNAEKAKDWSFLLTCLNNIGSMQKQMGFYAEGIATLEKGLIRAEQISLATDDVVKKLPSETLQKPEVRAEIAELKNMTRIRQMRYHKAGCLAGLGQKKEADELYQQLLKEAREANDTRLLEDLKNDGAKD